MKQQNKPALSDAMLHGVRRGSIYNIESGKNIPTGSEIWPNRPAVVVSNDALNEKSDFVTVVYLTTSEKRDMPYHVKVKSGKKLATALCEQIFSVDKSRLGHFIGEATSSEMDDIDVALQLSLSTIGVSQAKCLTAIRKWILALEKHDISLEGNPADKDEAPDQSITAIIHERNQYKNLYAQQLSITQSLLAAAQ